YNPGHGGSNGGYNPGHGGSNGGYTPGHGGNNGGYNPGPGGHHPGPGHDQISFALREAHRDAKRLFSFVINSFHPGMGEMEKRQTARYMRDLSRALITVAEEAPRPFRLELREVYQMVEDARFILMTEDSARVARGKLERAERMYMEAVRRFMGWNA
ncbi:MAG TPA: hypothetical protein PKO06_18150, partial [Candidatus Ozemobacteraceae bacterium]|nr:hypothetical protein [Candidatus Ozemobacteraceae bacterium]